MLDDVPLDNITVGWGGSLDRVAVDDAGRAGDVGQGEGRQEHEEETGG